MSAKGYISGNGPADRMLESLRGRPADPWSQEEAARLVEWKRAIRRAVPLILQAERNRTIASMRGRWTRRQQTHASVMEDVGKVAEQITALLDEMEQES